MSKIYDSLKYRRLSTARILAIVLLTVILSLFTLNTTLNLKRLLHSSSIEELPILLVITPTYTRPSQIADLTRLAQTLMHIPSLFWIIAEDSYHKSMAVTALLNRTGIPFVHLLAARPKQYDNVKKYGRGVANRLKALEWLRLTYADSSARPKGVIYFADDDNTYDIRLFDEIRFTCKVSVLPVGLISDIGLSAPIVDKSTGKVVGFHDPYIWKRKFAVDMAGFAVSLELFLSRPNATMVYMAGQQEDHFLRTLGVEIEDLEPKADNCTAVLVWHSKSGAGVFPSHKNIEKYKGYNETNLGLLYSNVRKGFL